MIRITCTNCRNVLSIDDAFAGGVCRCQHCGTIQTVPAHLKGSAEKTPAETGAGGTGISSKTLYRNEARGAVGSGSGLDDLANLVASSSGLSDPSLKARKHKVAVPPQKNQTIILLIAAGAIILLLIIVVLVLLLKGKSGSAPTGSGGDTSNSAPSGASSDNPGESANPAQPGGNIPPAATAPGFGSVKFSADTVVYLIDNGSSANDILDDVKAAVFRSVESLGSDRQFAILFWNPDSASYPSGSNTAFATKENIDDARKKLEDTIAVGKTDPGAALKKAVAANPGEIVLITAKGDDLDDTLQSDVLAIRGGSAAKIDTIAINGAPPQGVLARIASKTGGTFLAIPEGDVKGLGY